MCIKSNASFLGNNTSFSALSKSRIHCWVWATGSSAICYPWWLTWHHNCSCYCVLYDVYSNNMLFLNRPLQSYWRQRRRPSYYP